MRANPKNSRASDYLITGFFFAALFWTHTAITPISLVVGPSVIIDGITVAVEVVRTPQEQQKGLSGRFSLPDGSGMLFIFDHPDRYGFWMPNMHFAIDIVWIGADRRIVDVSERVTPESYPATFMPRIPARYVLEVSAGSVERYGWKVGDEVY